MSRETKERIQAEIESLKGKLENWNHTPMLQSVREIGAAAIKAELSKISVPLKK